MMASLPNMNPVEEAVPVVRATSRVRDDWCNNEGVFGITRCKSAEGEQRTGYRSRLILHPAPDGQR